MAKTKADVTKYSGTKQVKKRTKKDNPKKVNGETGERLGCEFVNDYIFTSHLVQGLYKAPSLLVLPFSFLTIWWWCFHRSSNENTSWLWCEFVDVDQVKVGIEPPNLGWEQKKNGLFKNSGIEKTSERVFCQISGLSIQTPSRGVAPETHPLKGRNSPWLPWTINTVGQQALFLYD